MIFYKKISILFILIMGIEFQSCCKKTNDSSTGSIPSEKIFGTYTNHRLAVKYNAPKSWTIPKGTIKSIYDWSKADFLDTISLYNFQDFYCIEILATISEDVSIETARKRVEEMKHLLEATIGSKMTLGSLIPVFRTVEGYIPRSSDKDCLYLRMIRVENLQ